MIVVVPMAGRGSRYSEHGFEKPKPLIEVAGKPMLLRALRSLEGLVYDKLIIIALEEHQEEYNISRILEAEGYTNFELILIPQVTEGQLSTVLAAKKHFNEDSSLLVSPSDTYIKSNLKTELNVRKQEVAGIISVFDLPGDRWSFAKTDGTNRVVAVAEKERISQHASTGIYYFSSATEFLKLAEEMISDNERTRGEFYIMPLYDKYINAGRRVEVSHASEMWDMGTPQSKNEYEKHLRYER